MAKKVDRDMTTLRISRTTKKRWATTKGKIQVQRQRETSDDDAVNWLIDYFDEHEKGEKK